MHTLAVDLLQYETLHSRVFVLERAKPVPPYAMRLSEVVTDATGAKLRSVADVPLPRKPSPYLWSALHVLSTEDGALAVVLTQCPELAVTHYVDGVGRKTHEQTHYLDASFMAGVKDVPAPVVLGSVIYFMDLTAQFRVLRFDLTIPYPAHTGAYALFDGYDPKRSITEGQLSVHPNGHVLACLRRDNAYCAIVEIDHVDNAMVRRSRIALRGAGAFCVHGDVLLAYTDQYGVAMELTWIHVPLAETMGTQRLAQAEHTVPPRGRRPPLT